ncbi:ROK family protein [Dactylosporangium sp. NPDC050688]|uniref:ROK family transcriptional regulator n=1 Tax=Dactylosporangium sp. NPDC050688 TaxID=3157217 RepID=UPI0033D95FD5
MREVNRSLVLALVKEGGPVSRASIARSTTLAKPTVSAIVDELISDGLVREVGPGSTAVSGGRPPILLEFNARSQLVVGAHIGARRTTVAIGDAAGEEIARREFPTPTALAAGVAGTAAGVAGTAAGGAGGAGAAGTAAGGVSPGDALRMVAAEARAAIQGTALPTARLAAVGAVLPGLTDFHTGVCLLAPNLGWRDVPVRDILAAELGAPVYVHNAGQAAAVAENLEGAGGRVGDLALLYAGTGLSAGVLSDGRVFHGVGGTAGEIGHNAVPGNEEPCNCGNVGCLETVASGPAIVRAVRRALAAGEPSSLAGLDTFDARDVATAARAGDALAASVIAEIGAHLGLAASWLINAYNPAVLVVGGGLAPIGDLLLDPLRAAVARHALAPALRGVEIRASVLGPDAEVRGAVLLALQHSETYYRVVFRA